MARIEVNGGSVSIGSRTDHAPGLLLLVWDGECASYVTLTREQAREVARMILEEAREE